MNTLTTRPDMYIMVGREYAIHILDNFLFYEEIYRTEPTYGSSQRLDRISCKANFKGHVFFVSCFRNPTNEQEYMLTNK